MQLISFASHLEFNNRFLRAHFPIILPTSPSLLVLSFFSLDIWPWSVWRFIFVTLNSMSFFVNDDVSVREVGP